MEIYSVMYMCVLCGEFALILEIIHPRWCRLEKAKRSFIFDEFSIPKAPIKRLSKIKMNVRVKVLSVISKMLVSSRSGVIF